MPSRAATTTTSFMQSPVSCSDTLERTLRWNLPIFLKSLLDIGDSRKNRDPQCVDQLDDTRHILLSHRNTKFALIWRHESLIGEHPASHCDTSEVGVRVRKLLVT